MGPNGFNSCAFKAAFLWDKQRTTKSQTPHFKTSVIQQAIKLCVYSVNLTQKGAGVGGEALINFLSNKRDVLHFPIIKPQSSS